MELKWLEDFICLAKRGNFSRASEDRNVTQPAFSRRIRALEAWVGVTLVDRSSHPIKLTGNGAMFLPQAQDILEAALVLRDDFRQLGDVQQNTIRLIALHTISINWLPAWSCELLQQLPDSVIEVIPSIQGVDQHFDSLLSGATQALIVYHHDSILSRADLDPGLQWKVIGGDRMVPVASKKFTELTGVKDIAEAEGEIPYLAFSSYSFSEKLIKPAADKVPGLKLCYQTGLSECLAAMVGLDWGVAWLPQEIIKEELKSGSFVIVGGDKLQVEFDIVAWRSRKKGSQVLETFWSLLEKATT